MHITCPYCQHRIKTPQAPAGVYAPSCPKCQVRFRLILSDKPPIVMRLEEGELSQSASLQASAAAETMAGASTAQFAGAPPDASALGSIHSTGALSGGATTSLPASEETGLTRETSVGANGHATKEWGNRERSASVESPNQPASEENRGPRPVAAKGKAQPVLAGCRLLEEIGRGAMGVLYRAWRRATEQEVALRVISGELSANRLFVSRLTREAYAAAQIRHPNLVSMPGMGADKGSYYFLLEYVPGGSLASVLESGKPDVASAISYTLQAARGLKHAHDCGLVHRDLKPTKLLLTPLGVVKVADLAIVKAMPVHQAIEAEGKGSSQRAAAVAAASSAGVKLANVALGTPSYMSLEQAENPAAVDPRSDVYSLGCCFYELLTGRPPLAATSAAEAASHLRRVPLTPPEVICPQVPPAVSAVVMKMIAVRPQDRYADMGQVVEALESLAGVKSSGPYNPTSSEAKTLEEAAERYNGAPARRLRNTAAFAMFAVWIMTFVFCALYGGIWLASCALATGLLAPLAHLAISGRYLGSPIYRRLRELAVAAPPADIVAFFVGLFAAAAAVVSLGMAGPFAVAAVIAICGMGLLHIAFDRRIRTQRQPPIASVQQLLGALRRKGIDEDSLRMLVARHSGPAWEDIFEQLYGYDAKLVARRRLPVGHGQRRRNKSRPWQDPLIAWLDAVLRAREQAHDRRHLTHTEEFRLVAERLTPAEARKRARDSAAGLVELARKVRHFEEVGPLHDATALAQKKSAIQAMLGAERQGKSQPPRRRAVLGSSLAAVLGPRARLVVGSLLILLACLAALRKDAPPREVSSASNTGQQAIPSTPGESPSVALAKEAPSLVSPQAAWRILQPAAAGLLLIALSPIRGRRIYPFAWSAAAVAWLGVMVGIPAIGGLPSGAISIAAGCVIGMAGLFLGRSRSN